MRTALRIIVATFATTVAFAWPCHAQTAPTWTIQREVAVTSDGETIVARRLRNVGGAPVVLFPGIGANLHEFDLPSRSIARHLADQGFDVWLFNNRASGAPGWKSTGDGAHSLDDMVTRDVPAAIDHVRRATGERPFVGGHSQGGMIALFYLAGAVERRVPVRRVPYVTLGGVRWRTIFAMRIEMDVAAAAARNADVRGLVLFAAPARFTWPAPARAWNYWRYSFWDYNLMLNYLAWSPSANAGAYTFPQVPGARVLEIITDDLPRFPYVGAYLDPFLHQVMSYVGQSFLASQLFYPGATDAHVLVEGLDLAVDNLPVASLRQFMEGIRSGGDVHELHILDPLRFPTSYSASLANVTAPTIWFAGSYDKLANEEAIAAAVPRLGALDRTFVRVPHGHVDLVIGDDAPQNVWAPLSHWLQVRR